MKITTVVLSALGLVSLSMAQNVYNTFATSLFNTTTVKTHVSVSVTPSPVRSNTYIKPITSIECWRNGYPCGQNGGQRSQRLVANFVRPTPALNARVPPPEWFASHPDVNMPGETDKPDDWVDMLPIPTSLGGTPLAKPTEMTPIHDEPQTYDAPPPAAPSGDPIVSVLPITPSPSAATSSHSASPPEMSALTTAPVAGEPYTVVIDCNRHYCTSGQQTIYTVTPEPYTYTKPPSATSVFAVPPVPTPAGEAAIPIEWWRSPGHPIVPDTPEGVKDPIMRHSSIESMDPIPTDDSCWHHYCLPESSASKVKPTPTTMLTTTKLVQPIRSVSLHFPDSPPQLVTSAA